MHSFTSLCDRRRCVTYCAHVEYAYLRMLDAVADLAQSKSCLRCSGTVHSACLLRTGLRPAYVAPRADVKSITIITISIIIYSITTIIIVIIIINIIIIIIIIYSCIVVGRSLLSLAVHGLWEQIGALPLLASWGPLVCPPRRFNHGCPSPLAGLIMITSLLLLLYYYYYYYYYILLRITITII